MNLKQTLYVLGFLVLGGLTVAALAQASEVTGNLTTGLNTPGVQGTVIVPPTANPPAGTYTAAQSVSLAASGSSSIYYTTDGTTPSCTSGTPYISAISVASSLSINAISCYPSSASSTVASFAYTITPPVVTPSFSGGGSFGGGGGGFGGSVIPLTSSQTSTSSTSTLPAVLAATISSAHPDGTLVASGTTIYLISGGQLHGFRDPQEFASYGYNFAQTVEINQADMLLPQGSIMKAMTGTLALDTSDNRTIYMVGQNYTKRGFVSMAVFEGLGYVKGSSTSGQAVHGMFKINMSDYPAGPPVASSTDAHPEGALVMDGSGTVWWIINGQKDGFQSLAVFESYGFTFDRVVPANAADTALSQGPLVKFRDGTLVSQGGMTYIISDGQKLPFATAQAFTSRGYSMANVIMADISSYTSGTALQ